MSIFDSRAERAEASSVRAFCQQRNKIAQFNELLALISLSSVFIFIAAVLLNSFTTKAAQNGSILESGCHGPELPFALLSPFLVLITLRLRIALQNSLSAIKMRDAIKAKIVGRAVVTMPNARPPAPLEYPL